MLRALVWVLWWPNLEIAFFDQKEPPCRDKSNAHSGLKNGLDEGHAAERSSKTWRVALSGYTGRCVGKPKDQIRLARRVHHGGFFGFGASPPVTRLETLNGSNLHAEEEMMSSTQT